VGQRVLGEMPGLEENGDGQPSWHLSGREGVFAVKLEDGDGEFAKTVFWGSRKCVSDDDDFVKTSRWQSSDCRGETAPTHPCRGEKAVSELQNVERVFPSSIDSVHDFVWTRQGLSFRKTAAGRFARFLLRRNWAG